MVQYTFLARMLKKKNAIKCKYIIGTEFKCWNAENVSRHQNCLFQRNLTAGNML